MVSNNMDTLVAKITEIHTSGQVTDPTHISVMKAIISANTELRQGKPPFSDSMTQLSSFVHGPLGKQ